MISIWSLVKLINTAEIAEQLINNFSTQKSQDFRKFSAVRLDHGSVSYELWVSDLWVNFMSFSGSEAYSEPCQTPEMEL